MVNVRCAVFDAESLTEYVTVEVPTASGLPLTLRPEALNDNPEGKPDTLNV